MATTSENLFCRMADLSNEASVESFFVMRLLKELGYEDSEILPKTSIQELKIGKGRKKEPYRPDYILQTRKLPRWLIDAKATGEDIEAFTYQCAGYALLINRKHEHRPLKHYMLTNGLLTRVYQWDQEEAVLSLRFDDFAEGNPKYETLRRLLSAPALNAGAGVAPAPGAGHKMGRPTLDVVKKAFLRCHRFIWTAEKVSPQAAFVGFAKLLFVKLWEDRRLRDSPALMTLISKGEPLPADAVRFSSRWIESQESFDPNPIDTILFKQLVDQLEGEIARKKRKRIFESSERLGMSPGTVKRIVGVLEHQYLFGIDEDLNGRMFEAFLAATMRGQDLGQYFTPRSVVKLVAKLARPEATRGKVDKVLDGCCGTGGFLIEALADMRKQLYDNESLTQQERGKLLDEVANASIFGIDASRDPPLARIARINMYLHGDGGSRVYVADALRSPPEASPSDSVEIRENVGELRDFLGAGLRFNVVLTNPPFSMDYSLRIPDEKLVLENYDLRTHGGKARAKLRSSVMFIERYGQLLEPGGRLLTIIDESVLSGKAYAYVRDFIRQRFILRAVISLHGDAFQRAGARVKTSILYLTLKRSHDEEQTAAFVYESRYIGVDDVVAKTPPSVAEKARADAAEEMSHILRSFDDYLRGGRGPWLVPAGRLGDRLDAKYLLPWSVSELERAWEAAGATTATLDTLVDPVEDEPLKLDPGKQYTYLKVTYEGRAEPGERRLGREVTYPKVTEAKADDIVVSHIRAVDRAVCVVPKELAGLLISPEYTVLRLKEGCQADPMYLWNVLRSAAVVAELLTTSSGQARYRVDWSKLAGQKVPLLPIKQQRLIGNHHRAVLEHEKEIRERQEGARRAMASLELDGPTARDKLARAKPPR